MTIRVRSWLVLVLYSGIVPYFCFRETRVVLAGPSVNVGRELRSVSKPLGVFVVAPLPMLAVVPEVKLSSWRYSRTRTKETPGLHSVETSAHQL